jgi:hypothetical protein
MIIGRPPPVKTIHILILTHYTLKMEATHSSKTLVTSYKTS